MRRQDFWIAYLILLALQLVVSNFCNVSPYVVLSLLPAMILCTPISMHEALVMLTAFLSGLAVDFLADGVIGLNAFALVPAGMLRNWIIRLVFGEELFARDENFTLRRGGILKSLLAAILSSIPFFVLYCWADGAGTLPAGFQFLRMTLSVLASLPLSFACIYTLANDKRQ